VQPFENQYKRGIDSGHLEVYFPKYLKVQPFRWVIVGLHRILEDEGGQVGVVGNC